MMALTPKGGPQVRANPSGLGDPTKGWDPGVKTLTPKDIGNSTEKEGERLSCGWEPSKEVLLPPWWSPKTLPGTLLRTQGLSYLPLSTS